MAAVHLSLLVLTLICHAKVHDAQDYENIDVESYSTKGGNQLGCLDETGNLKEWYILYKIPKIKGSSNNNVRKGEGYAYVDSGKWVLSNKKIDDPASHLFRTIKQIWNNKKGISFLMYNDQDPITGRSGQRYGHTKGVLAVNDKTGFWIVHSIPRFPPNPSNSNPIYPETGKLYGQSVLCLTFKTDMLQKILTNFLYTVPYIYAHKSGPGLQDLPENLRTLFTSNDYYVQNKPPWTYSSAIKSLHGTQEFLIFGKHVKWHKDLYDALVAPNLKAPLFVETWSKGTGNPMDSSCEEEYQVMNVKSVSIQTNSIPISFSSKNDHSKWAVTEKTRAVGYVCIGDINRVESQKKRGGGTVCIKSQPAWSAFNRTVSEIDDCKV